MVNAGVICLDADYTMINYKVVEFMQLQYRSLSKCMVKLGFSDLILNPPWISQMTKLFLNGSLADFKTGFVLKLAHDNTILRAFYGIELVSYESLVEKYGNPPTYNLEQIEYSFVKGKRFLFVTQFYAGAFFTFCSGVELHKRGILELDSFNDLGEKIYLASELNYSDSYHERELSSEFFPEFYANPEKFLYTQNDEVKNQLTILKLAGKKLILITNSCTEYTNAIFEFAYGHD